jgi:Cof subfamily protein (haloacid dehalogenase superfamily)
MMQFHNGDTPEISVVAVDLDDTIVRSDGAISERTLDALHTWEDRGGHVIIATGRPPRSTRHIPHRLHHLPWICYNGAVIHHGEAVLYEDFISSEDTRLIVETILAASPNVRVGIEIGDVLYMNQPVDRPGVQHVVDLLSVANQPSAKVILTIEHYRQIEPMLTAFPASARVLLSEKYNIVQIMPYTTSKERALRHLLDKLALSMENVVAFGDDVNDVEMVAEAGLGVAMDNAVSEVKAVADRITATNDEDGVALVVEELLARAHDLGSLPSRRQ